MKVLVLLLLACACAVATSSKATLPVAPALIAGLNAKGVTNFLNQILPTILAKLQNLQLPDQSGSKDSFDFSVSNAVIHSVSYTNFLASVGSEVTFTLSGASISGSLDWKYKERIWPHVPYGSGSADFSGTAGVIQVSFKVNSVQGTDGLLYPQIVVDSCQVDVSSINVSVHGSILSWLYDIIIALFKNQLKSAANNVIQGALTNALNVQADKLLATLPYKVKFGTWGLLDYSITGAAEYLPTPGNLYLPFKAEVYAQGSTAEAPLPHYLAAYNPTGRMIDILLDVFAINSALYQVQQHNLWDFIINNNTWIAQFPQFPALNTHAWSAIFPTLQTTYPDMPMQLELTLQGPPSISTSDGSATGNIPLLLQVEVLPSGGGTKTALGIFVNVTAVVDVKIGSQPTLLVQVGSPTNIGLSVVSTTIGPVDVTLLQLIVNSLLQSLVIPDLNKALSIGFPLPAIGGVSFFQPILSLQQNTILIATDFQYTPQLF